MLRRGGSNNKKVDENILLLQNTLIGSDPDCDIVIKVVVKKYSLKLK